MIADRAKKSYSRGSFGRVGRVTRNKNFFFFGLYNKKSCTWQLLQSWYIALFSHLQNVGFLMIWPICPIIDSNAPLSISICPSGVGRVAVGIRQ